MVSFPPTKKAFFAPARPRGSTAPASNRYAKGEKNNNYPLVITGFTVCVCFFLMICFETPTHLLEQYCVKLERTATLVLIRVLSFVTNP